MRTVKVREIVMDFERYKGEQYVVKVTVHGHGRCELHVRRGKGGKVRTVKIGDHLKQCLRWCTSALRPSGTNSIPRRSCCAASVPEDEPCAIGIGGRRIARRIECMTPGTVLELCFLKPAVAICGCARKRSDIPWITTTTTVYADVVDEKVQEEHKAMDRVIRQTMSPSATLSPDVSWWSRMNPPRRISTPRPPEPDRFIPGAYRSQFTDRSDGRPRL